MGFVKCLVVFISKPLNNHSQTKIINLYVTIVMLNLKTAVMIIKRMSCLYLLIICSKMIKNNA